MSLIEANFWQIVKNQYNYKCRAYLSVFSTLMIAQLVSFFFSFVAGGMMGTSIGTLSIHISYVSGSMIIAFTMLWGLITSILLTTKPYRESDFAFVTNRLSSNLSNILFLVMASVLGGVSAMLLGLVQKIILFYREGAENIIGGFITPLELLVGTVAAILYILLFSALGYFAGSLVQISKLFVVLLPASFFGIIYLGVTSDGQSNRVLNFFGEETSLIMLSVKIVSIAVALYLSSILITNRLEVKK